MSRAKQRADRIRSVIPIVRVLSDYGYNVNPNGGDREQQFSCDLHGDGVDATPSARVYPASNSWYCVDIRERVLTSRGWLRMDDVRRTMQGRFIRDFEYQGGYPDSCGLRDYSCLRCGWTVKESGEALHRSIDAHKCPQAWKVVGLPPVDVLNGRGDWETPVRYIRRSPMQMLVEVKTRAGYSVRVTPDHEIEVVGQGWLPAQNIKRGDVLVIPKPTTPQFSRVLTLPVEDLNTRKYGSHPRLNLPSEWSVEMGECLGYVFGDGWVIPRTSPGSGIVGLTSHANDVEDARRIFKLMQAWSSGRGSEVHRTSVAHVYDKAYVQDQYVFTVSNNGFCEFFLRMGLDKSVPASERTLPESIWQAPDVGVRGFLRGIYAADGSIYRPKNRKGIRVNLYSVSEAFLRDVQLLLLQCGIHSRLHPPSRSRIKEGARQGKHTHPAWYLQLATGRDILSFREMIGVSNVRKQAVLDSFVFNPRGSRSFSPVVDTVTPIASAWVADISMPVEHSFVAGGIKVHNCFVCDRTRSAIETYREKQGVDFWTAVHALEKQYGLPDLPWEDGYVIEPKLSDMVRSNLVTDKTLAELRIEVERCLTLMTRDREHPLPDILRLWEIFDHITYDIDAGDPNVTVRLARLLGAVRGSDS